jgi:CheY-like chemotaxis protein
MTANSLSNKGRPANILLVEDNPGDVILTQRALKDARIANHVFTADTGETALAMLRRETGYEKVPMPDLILLDLNLPQMSGQDVLSIVKSDIKLKKFSCRYSFQFHGRTGCRQKLWTALQRLYREAGRSR